MQHYLRAVGLLSAILSLIGSVAFADFASKDWKYQKEITLPSISSTQFVELTFDEEVFANAAAGLRDVRIVNGNGQEVSYKLVVERSDVERAQLSGRILDKSFVPGEYSSFVVDLGRQGLFHNQLDIQSSSVNFRREVTVEGSNNKINWAVLETKEVIYDYTDPAAGLKARDTRVRYPESTVQYLRVKISNRGEEPLSISGASIYLEKQTQAKTVSYPAAIVDRVENSERQATQLVVDLGSAGLPNNTLSLDIPQTNFQRDIALEGSNDRQNWRIIVSRDVIFSFNTPKFNGAKLQLSYPEQTYQYLRITIFNQDNPSLTVNNVLAGGVLRKLVFEAAPGVSYALFYGNSQARYPQYDLERYFQYLETENLSQATLGMQKPNASFEEKVPSPPPLTERYPWLLPLALGISVLALGFLLVRLFLSIRHKILPPNE